MPLSRSFELVTFKQLFLDDRDLILTPRGGFVIFNKDVDALQVYITSPIDTPVWQQLLSYYNNDAYPSGDEIAIWNASNERFEMEAVQHDLLDGDWHGDTADGTVLQGDVIIGATGPKWTRLSKPNAGSDEVYALAAINGQSRPVWHLVLDGVTAPQNVAASAASGTSLLATPVDHVHAHPASQHAAGGAIPLYSPHTYVFPASAALNRNVTVGDQQGGFVHHSYDSAETVKRIVTEFGTAPTGQDAIIQLEYGDTDDMDTVGSWTEIELQTHTDGAKTVSATSGFTNATIPANRVIRMNLDQRGSTVKGQNLTAHLQVLRPLVAS